MNELQNIYKLPMQQALRSIFLYLLRDYFYFLLILDEYLYC